MPTQTTNISGVPVGITYSAAEKWTVGKGVSVDGVSIGVTSTYAGSALVNKGKITGGLYSVFFDAGGLPGQVSVKNAGAGEIGGAYGVVMVQTSSALLDNKGKVNGTSYGVAMNGSADIKIVNKGEISGGQYGIWHQQTILSAKGRVIENSGTIEGGQYGIVLEGAVGITSKITNEKGGTISGPQVAFVSQERTLFKNDGKVEGKVVLLNDYDNKIVNKGNIKGDVKFGGGDDVFKAQGKKAKAGMVDLGDGNDKMIFGKKADKLLFDSALNAATNVDTLKKFQSGKDKLYLDDDIFTAIMPGTLSSAQFHKGAQAADADDRIIYDKKTGALYYDPDGSGAMAQIQFAKLDKGAKLKASDFTIGEFSI